ncbi:MAG: AbrB/MazE/SpoVT family DNA-binding domain-containing protein [Candidatus Odinarchaeota archaeon]|nr:AbrB/MazE/SpoVT family DNA-binding domain-containing protein [Candidatus Odinarchaeota archaeon]
MPLIVILYDDQGRTKLPIEILKALNLKKGDKLLVKIENNKIVLKPVNTKKWSKLEGIDEEKALKALQGV